MEKELFDLLLEDLRFYRGSRLRTSYLRPKDLELRLRARHGHLTFLDSDIG